MIESIKKKLWDLLKEKDVSLAILYNRKGEILWHKGREIDGKTIDEGKGFSRSYLKKVFDSHDTVEGENIVIASIAEGLPESARILKIKSLIIQPIGDYFYLYMDSGIKKTFTGADRQAFTVLGEFLEIVIEDIIRQSEFDKEGVTGSSREIKRIREQVLKYSLEEEPVLLLGETGVGKSHVAELLHRFSGRRGKFIPIHTPSIPGNLFESELFGHKKGAFTDARSDKKGMVAEGEGGTLFFDEISEVPLAIQAKLLRFIETRKYIVLGETCERTADVRIVAATNRDMHQAIEEKEFREDLYYRLQVLEIEIPPLRQRKEDVKTLVLENMELLRDKGVGKGFWEAVSDYLWPGNVRELLTVLRRAGIMLDGPVTGDDIRELIRRGRYKKPVIQDGNTVDNTGRMWEELRSGKSFWEAVKAPFLQREVNRAEVKALVVRGLDLAGGKYVDLLRLFHVEKKDYHKFMAFLSDNKLK